VTTKRRRTPRATQSPLPLTFRGWTCATAAGPSWRSITASPASAPPVSHKRVVTRGESMSETMEAADLYRLLDVVRLATAPGGELVRSGGKDYVCPAREGEGL